MPETINRNRREHDLNYALHIGLTSPEDGLFAEQAGSNPIDQIKFIAEQGFAGIEDNFLKLRPIEVQEKIGKELERYGMQMGCFVNNLVLDHPTFVSNSPEASDYEPYSRQRLHRTYGMEHSVSQPGAKGEQAVLEIYDALDRL